MEPSFPGPRYINPIAFVRALTYPTPWMREAAATYGDTFRMKTVFGPVVVTSDPDAVRTMFTADPDTFEVFHPETSAPFIGETALILVSGPRHRRDRKLLSPPFNGARMRAYGSVMRAAADRMIASWKKGSRLRMLDSTQTVSLDVIIEAVFGIEEEDRARKVREAVIKFIGAMSAWIVFFPAIRRNLFGLGPWDRFEDAIRNLDALLYEIIALRRREDKPREDILSMMMSARYDDGGAMSDKELRDQLLTLLFAGHETTAIALSWALYWLHKDPAELARAREEIASLGPDPAPDALAELPYLDAICHETLRIRPIVPDIPRMLRQPVEIAGKTVPAGMGLLASALLVHSREDLYPDPDRFRPSRFLERKFTPFEFLPFGGGARRCIGAAFAVFEMKIVLAEVLSRCSLRLAGDREPKATRRGFTVGPDDGVPMIYEGPR